MKKYAILIAVLILLPLIFASSATQNGYDLFQKALAKERGEGNLEEAIALYKKVVKEASDESLAAKAQLRIGICYEKLGMKEAQKAFQKVIDNYPSQTETVKVAKEKLSILLRAQTVIEKGDKEFRIRKIGPCPETGMGEISPDGRYLSHVNWNTGDLAVFDIATGKSRNLTKKEAWDEAHPGFAETSIWSPDSKQVVYLWYGDINGNELRIVGLDDSGPRTLCRLGKHWVEPKDWSFDGKYILAEFFPEDSCALGLISVSDGSIRMIKTLKWGYPYSIIRALFSPDGRYIAYDFPQKEGASEYDIFLFSIDGSLEISLVPHPAHDCLLGWAPDGKRILFTSNRTGTTDAWLIKVAEGKPQGDYQLVRRAMGSIKPLGFTQESSFYFNTPRLMDYIYTTTIDPATGKIIDPPKKLALAYEGYNMRPAWSPDGKYIAYTSLRGHMNRRYVLCIYSVETKKIRELTFKRNLGFQRWSSDGRSILVQATVGSGRSIYRIDAQTGDVVLVIQRKDGEYLQSAQFSHDGKSIFYIKENESKNPYQILVRDLETGKEKELYRTPPFDNNTIALSPDGKRLALLMRVEKGVRTLNLMPAEGGEPKELHRFKQGGRWIIDIAWSPDSRYIYFYKSSPNWKWELWRIPSEGGKAQDLGLRMVRYDHINVHPDGRQITFSSRPLNAKPPELWVMENFLPSISDKK